MIIVRMYQVLGELVVESTAHGPFNDALGARGLQGIFLGRTFFDATSAINPEELSEALYRVTELADPTVCTEFGGWHSLL